MNNDESLCRSRFFFCTLAGIALILAIALIAELSRTPEAATSSDSVAEAVANDSDETPFPHLDIQHWTSSLGTKVYFIRTEQPELLDIQLNFNSGSVRDGNLYGLSELTARLIGSATDKRSGDEIAQIFEQEGSLFYHYSDREQITIGMRSLSETKHLLPSIASVTEATAHPVFLPSDLSRIKNQLLETIKSNEQNPMMRSMLKANTIIYKNSPYSHSKWGTERSLTTITPDDIKTFHQRYFSARNLTISMVGDITREQAEQISEQISLALPVGAQAPPPALPQPATKGTSEHIEMDTSQSTIVVATLGVPRKSPDYAALFLANEIFGGAFGSLLLKEIRENQGLAYSAYSSLVDQRYTGKFQIITQTRSEQATHTLTEIKRLLSYFVSQGPTDKQLNDAKKIIIGSFPMQSASNDQLLSLLSDISFYQLPIDKTQQFIKAIHSLTGEQVKAAFANMVNMKTLTVITTGKKLPN